MADWDRIVTSAPVDQKAAKQMGRGVGWKPKAKLYQDCDVHSDTTIPFVAPTKDLLLHPDFVDFTGHKYGRMTVLGLYAERRSRWVVRCACGRHEIRTAKAIKARGGPHCKECGYVDYLRCGMTGGQE